MGDLYTGLAIMSALMLGLGLGTWWATARAPKWLLDTLALAVIGGIVAFVFLLRDDVVLARWLPYSNLVIVGNWLPLFAGVLAGLLVRRIQGRPTSQVLWAALLIVTASSAMFDPFRGEPPGCRNESIRFPRHLVEITGREPILVVHNQTSRVTCSPAAAATLLGEYGIDMNEEQMASLSLTRKGTTWQGLYRGLMLATEGTPWTVEVFETDERTLTDMSGPKLLFVELQRGTDYDPRYASDFGWIPGQRHTVVLFESLRPGRLVIADPSLAHGLEEWSRQDLETLWHGQGMRLVRRDRPTPLPE